MTWYRLINNYKHSINETWYRFEADMELRITLLHLHGYYYSLWQTNTVVLLTIIGEQVWTLDKVTWFILQQERKFHVECFFSYSQEKERARLKIYFQGLKILKRTAFWIKKNMFMTKDFEFCVGQLYLSGK